MKPTARIMLYLPPDLAEWLTDTAKQTGKPRNDLIIACLNAAREALGTYVPVGQFFLVRSGRDDPNATG